jgi:xanthine dehydrogenase accessory factor
MNEYERTDIYEEIVALRRAGSCAVLATIISGKGSVPSMTSSKLLVRQDGTTLGSIGGGFVETEVCRLAAEILREERPRKIAFDLNQHPAADRGMVCGGTMEIYLEPIIPPPTLYLFGAGQTPLSVYQIAHLAGFDVTVLDDHPEQLSAERFPSARRLVGKVAELLPELSTDSNSYVIIMTRGHSEDMEILRWAVTTNARYVGMIGSKRKVISIFKHLRDNGVDTDLLKRVHAPIGLDIGALTPEEIAVSAVAELISIRRNSQGNVEHLKNRKTIEILSRVS